MLVIETAEGGFMRRTVYGWADVRPGRQRDAIEAMTRLPLSVLTGRRYVTRGAADALEAFGTPFVVDLHESLMRPSSPPSDSEIS